MKLFQLSNSNNVLVMYVLVTLCIGDVNVLVMFVMYSKVRISSKLDNPSNSFFSPKILSKKKRKIDFPVAISLFLLLIVKRLWSRLSPRQP